MLTLMQEFFSDQNASLEISKKLILAALLVEPESIKYHQLLTAILYEESANQKGLDRVQKKIKQEKALYFYSLIDDVIAKRAIERIKSAQIPWNEKFNKVINDYLNGLLDYFVVQPKVRFIKLIGLEHYLAKSKNKLEKQELKATQHPQKLNEITQEDHLIKALTEFPRPAPYNPELGTIALDEEQTFTLIYSDIQPSPVSCDEESGASAPSLIELMKDANKLKT